MKIHKRAPRTILFCSLLLAGLIGCSDDDNNDDSADSGGNESPVEDMTRVQDTRTFAVDESSLPFEALEGFETSDRWWGVRPNGAGFRVEVPENWNGQLVMYAHGYRGETEELTVSSPSIRYWLLDNGYAWAASSYSSNYYDVRAGVEDTNELALAFGEIAAANGRSLDDPGKIYIHGHSMGGHITAAAIEQETFETANNKVQYAGAVPMCGVLGDTFEFDFLTQFTMAAQHLASQVDSNVPPLTSFPATNYDANLIAAALWDTPPTLSSLGSPNAAGLTMMGISRNLSGGERPIADIGYLTYYYHVVMGTGGSDGTINGILAKPSISNTGVTYQFDNDPTVSVEEQAFNDTILRIEGEPDSNPLRDDGLRWVPLVNGEFNIPVVVLQGLGDLYVPFRHAQLYQQRVEANGNGDWLVQRAIRNPGHCDFTDAEEEAAFADMIAWEQGGEKPAGDDVLDAATVADANYGCQFTLTDRTGLPACSN